MDKWNDGVLFEFFVGLDGVMKRGIFEFVELVVVE